MNDYDPIEEIIFLRDVLCYSHAFISAETEML
jgi:hypothetical protein